MTASPPLSRISEPRLAVLVLGMHRSGTSALTRLLGHLDLAMPRDGIDAHVDNAKGYWEPKAVVANSDRILRVARTSWFDPRPLLLDRIPPDLRDVHRANLHAAVSVSFGDAPRIAIKDPRICRMVPLIADALRDEERDVRAVLMLRPSAAIVQSLCRRDRFTPAYAYALWLRHMIDAERDTRAMPRTFVTYDGLLDDWRSAMARLADLVGRPDWSPDADTAHAIDDFLDPGLRHHVGAHRAALDPDLDRIVTDFEQALWALTEADDDDHRARIDAVARAWDEDRHRLDDILHDELRHCRFAESRLRAAHPEPEETTALEPLSREPVPAPSEAAPPPPPPPVSIPMPAPLAEQVETIRNSRLFDADWYRARYPDAAVDGIDPIVHYLTIGAERGYDPNPLFQTGYYAWQLSRRDAAEAL